MRIVLPLICVAGLLVPGGPGSAGDARVGTVSDLQGSAWYRPVARERWTPLGVREALMPGDQVRTSPRGANAVEILLNKGGGVVVGPGTMVDFAGGGVRLYRGELEIRPGKGGSVPATGPGGFQKDCSARTLLRAGRQSTEELGQDPRWLTGYRASTTDEWMGSLVAKIDGRDVPLSVGYHKVTVDIRDQISRTTVEQSFVNSTVQRLEGVFYFPLPPDASISGFGMWIGDELVEADIVEKQRARAIYEDILRRKKDP
ncbi:MAG: VIT domain-containing protein, partial [Planctomycetota bacterium]